MPGLVEVDRLARAPGLRWARAGISLGNGQKVIAIDTDGADIRSGSIGTPGNDCAQDREHRRRCDAFFNCNFTETPKVLPYTRSQMTKAKRPKRSTTKYRPCAQDRDGAMPLRACLSGRFL